MNQPRDDIQYEETDPANTSLPAVDRNLALRRLQEGKLLDVLCAGGRKGGTSFLPVNASISSETQSNLQVTARYIPSGTNRRVRTRELENPSSIPVIEYKPRTSSHFWRWIREYAEKHAEDSAARVFGMVHSTELQSFTDSQDALLGSSADLEEFHKLDIPLFVVLQSRAHLRNVLAKIAEGRAQGLILKDSKQQLPKFRERWQEFLAKQMSPELVARPFLGLQGTTKSHLEFMTSHKVVDQDIDTLVFTDTPTDEEARRLKELHLAKMRKGKKAKVLPNAFDTQKELKTGSNDDEKDEIANIISLLPTIRIGVIDVQGGARADAIALLRASRHTLADISVSLIENTEQFDSENPHAIVLPGGWHGLQYNLQEQLGLNERIIDQVVKQKRKDLLALCAGAIQARTSDNAADETQNIGCQIGTALGIGDFKIVNNAYNTPHDIILTTHDTKDEKDRTVHRARIYQQIPLSNAPYMQGINHDSLDVLAKISTTEWAESVEEDDGNVIGVQVKQSSDRAPVRMAFGFHHESAFLLFLHDLQLRIVSSLTHELYSNMRREFQKVELEAGL